MTYQLIPSSLDIVCLSGDTFTLAIEVVDGNDAPYNFAGHSGVLEVRELNGDELIVASLTLASGTMSCAIAKAVTAGWTACEYQHAITVTSPSGAERTYCTGKFTVVSKWK